MLHSQISRTPSLATQILEKKVFHEKNSKEIQSRDYQVFCLHPRQTRQQWIEKYFIIRKFTAPFPNGLADKPHLRF